MWLISLLVLVVIGFFLFKAFKNNAPEQNSGAPAAQIQGETSNSDEIAGAAVSALRRGNMATAPSSEEQSVAASKLRHMLA